MKRLLLWIAACLTCFVVGDRVVDAMMMRGINRFYGLDRPGSVLLMGHSHLMLATDKERLERELGVTVSKYTREGVGVSDRLVMVRHFLSLPGADSLRLCLYGVDLCTFTVEGLSQNAYKLCYPFMDNDDMDAYIRSEADDTDYWLHKLVHTSRFADDALKNAAVRGWVGDWSNRKYGTIDIEAYRRSIANGGGERLIKMNATLVSQFEETMRLLTSRGVHVVLVNTPTLDLLNNLDPEAYDGIISWFGDYAAKNPLIDFWDLNPQYSARHELFFDRIHTNAEGQEVVTEELVKKIKTLNIL